jgi:RNA polymerase-associated protein
VRLALAEKNIRAEIIDVGDDNLPEDLLDLNPYNTLPTMVERDLVLYSSNIIMEYVEERYPHPPLMPVDPISRARARSYLYRMDNDWYSLLTDLQGSDSKKIASARKQLRDGLTLIAPALLQKPFFMSNEISLADCSLLPLLWRLPMFGVELPDQAKPLQQYADRMFVREGFRNSLSFAERSMR